MHRADQPRRVDVEGHPRPAGPKGLIRVAAQAVAVRHPLVIKDLADLVRLVALHAHRDGARPLLPHLPPDDLAVDRLNLRVAAGAGGGDVSPRDGGAGIAVWQEAQVADTLNPFLSNPSPWMLSA